MEKYSIEHAICVKFKCRDSEIEFYTRDGFTAANMFFNELRKSDAVEYIDFKEEVVEDGLVTDSVLLATI